MVGAISNNPASSVSGTGPAGGAGGASPAAVSAGVSGSAAYLSALLSATTPVADAGSSGLRSPVNPENSEALLLLVESQFDRASAATRGESLASRFGKAQIAIGASAAALTAAVGDVTTAQGKLASSQAKLAADTKAGAGSDALSADQKAVDAAQAGLTTAQTALNALNLTADVRSAVALVARGLGADVSQDASRATGRSAHRDIAYEDVGGTAKRFREDEVDRTRQDGAQRAQDGAKRDEDRGETLAAAVAAGMADAMATIQNLLASRPPAVSATAAMEAGGRVRLSL